MPWPRSLGPEPQRGGGGGWHIPFASLSAPDDWSYGFAFHLLKVINNKFNSIARTQSLVLSQFCLWLKEYRKMTLLTKINRWFFTIFANFQYHKNRALSCLFPEVVIHHINQCTEDNRVCFVNFHPLDSDSSHSEHYPPSGTWKAVCLKKELWHAKQK